MCAPYKKVLRISKILDSVILLKYHISKNNLFKKKKIIQNKKYLRKKERLLSIAQVIKLTISLKAFN